MDLGILAAIAMLVLWTLGTFFFDAPGWIHLLLTLGLFLLFWRIAVRGDPLPSDKRGDRARPPLE